MMKSSHTIPILRARNWTTLGRSCQGVWTMAGMFVFLSVLSIVRAEPLRVDLTAKAPPTITGHIGLGQTNAPGGHTLWADSVALYRDGKPWIPVMGEIHYTRYPRAEWRDALLKMKAGGVDIVATYVFWIHHEEVKGEYDWSGQRSLRDFLMLCRELNLLSVVRLGPWSHGEVRNGGFPDWLQHAAFWPDKSGFKNRTTHPEFMKLVENHYRQISAQMQGLLWKDGGPVIGVQHDNECWNLPYLFALKKLARDCGIDVTYYTMTGWNSVPIPDADLLPLFGAYTLLEVSEPLNRLRNLAGFQIHVTSTSSQNRIENVTVCFASLRSESTDSEPDSLS